MKDGKFWEKEKSEKKNRAGSGEPRGGCHLNRVVLLPEKVTASSHKELEGISPVDSRGRPFQNGETEVLRLLCWRSNSKDTSVIDAE